MIDDQELRAVTYAIVNAMALGRGISVSFEVFDSIFDQLGDEAAWGRAAIEAMNLHRTMSPTSETDQLGGVGV